jgi:hypothetical protein
MQPGRVSFDLCHVGPMAPAQAGALARCIGDFTPDAEIWLSSAYSGQRPYPVSLGDHAFGC